MTMTQTMAQPMTQTVAHTPPIMPMRLEGLGFSAGGKTRLDDITLQVEKGERLIVLGPNGAGKSLLLRLCHGLLTPDRGRVIWGDHAPQTRPAAQAMVFQHPVLLRRSVWANLDYALSLQKVARAARGDLIDTALRRFGLSAQTKQGARLLSGGEQQRLALARVWLCRPEILFLDEPTAALDPSATRQIEEIISAFNDEGMTIVMTTHHLGQARRLAQRVAFLDRGRLREITPAPQFFASAQTAQARAFLAGDLLW